MQARELLTKAQTLYDDRDLPFARMAQQEGWRAAFESGSVWMRTVMGHVRKADIPPNSNHYNVLGIVKYGLASLGVLAFLALIIWTRWWLLLPGVVLIFYAIEAQMVFLFPLAIDGGSDLMRQSRSLTVRAGGTLPVTITVLQLAAVMLFGGFFGRGFVRSWALGCLAVVLWYEDVRHAPHRIAR